METNVLDLKFKSNDLGKKVTIRQFFFELMKTLWIEQEGFSGKRPFGNSCWDGDLISCLIKNKLIKGKLDEDGYLADYDKKADDKYVMSQILKPLFGVS
jgi:hypothetical protein